MQVGQELLALGGVARRADLVRVTGLAPRVVARELAVLVGSGEVTNPRRGIYAVRGAPRDAVTAVAASGVLTCVSIAAMWRLPLLTAPVAAHVAIPASASGSVRSRVPGGTVLHRDLGIAPGQRFDRPEPALALAHAIQCLPLPEAVAVLDAAVGRGLVRREDLAARRPRKGWLAHERATRLIDTGSGSIGESIARVALVGAGLTVQTQARIPGVGRVDMLVEGLVVVEVDGFAYHSGRQEFREDRRRDRVALVRHGLAVLRFAFEDAVYDTERLVETVRAALAAARDRPQTVRRSPLTP